MPHSDCSLAYALGLILYTLRLDKGASHILVRQDTGGRNHMPMLCLPMNAAPKTIVGPTSLIGRFVAPPPDQKRWDAPNLSGNESTKVN